MQNRILRRAGTLVALALSTILLLACPQHTKIGELTSNPGRYAGKEVSIAGSVVSSYGALGTGAFEMDDGSGRIWVISQNYGVPAKNAKVGITGVVTQGVSVAGRSFAVALRQTSKPHY